MATTPKDYDIQLDTKNKIVGESIILVQGDNNGNIFHFTLTENDEIIDLTGATVTITMVKSDNTKLVNQCILTDAVNGKCDYVVDIDALAIQGKVVYTVEIYRNNGRTTTNQAKFKVIGELDDGTGATSEGNYNVLSTLIEEVNTTENTIIANENVRKSNENTRINNENIRQSNEANRINTFNTNETNRQTTFDNNEAGRQDTFDSNELNRSNTFNQSETDKQNTFNTNESLRQNTFDNNELTRQVNENIRIINEDLRQSNEVTRQSNEANRQKNFNDMAHIDANLELSSARNSNITYENFETLGLRLDGIDLKSIEVFANKEIITIQHDLDCYPNCRLITTNYGAGIGGAGVFSAGGTESYLINAKICYLDTNNIKIFIPSKYYFINAELQKINDTKYILTSADSMESILINLLEVA